MFNINPHELIAEVREEFREIRNELQAHREALAELLRRTKTLK